MSSPGDGRPPDEPGRPDPAAPNSANPLARPPHGWRPAVGGSPGYEGQQYGQPPSARPPYEGAATPEEPPYVYNPYGNFPYPASYPTPAGLGPEPELPPKRPGSLHLALLLVVVAALPYLFVGLAAVAVAPQAASALPPEDLAQLQQLGVDIAQVMRATGFLILVIALAYVVLGVLAWTGRRWARALLGAFTAGFVLMIAAAVVGGGSQGLGLDAGSLLVLVVPLVLALAALALMFGGAARDWFARRR